MDRRLHEALVNGEVSLLHSLTENDENIIKQTVQGSQHTGLHLAARFGHEELASEIIKLCPEMVSVENIELETPLHEACREGHLEIIKLLLESDSSIIYRVNSHEESALFAACERGKIDAVKHLMNFPRLFVLE
ncbi:ankyrin repeat-containing At5g02620-like, partial [Olea europaea subsp. europaea]